jgi:hypothetical protein
VDLAPLTAEPHAAAVHVRPAPARREDARRPHVVEPALREKGHRTYVAVVVALDQGSTLASRTSSP